MSIYLLGIIIYAASLTDIPPAAGRRLLNYSPESCLCNGERIKNLRLKEVSLARLSFPFQHTYVLPIKLMKKAVTTAVELVML
jgi:hypothetical protein